MSNVAEETSSNVFYKAHCTASKHNEQMCGCEGAAAMMAFDRGRLYRTEKGVAGSYLEEIHPMSGLYNTDIIWMT